MDVQAAAQLPEFSRMPGFDTWVPVEPSQIAFLAVCPCLDPQLLRKRDRPRR